MTNQSITVLALAFVFTAGCKKDTPNAVTTTSATPTAVASVAVPKDDCAAGYTKIPNPGFCIKLPTGYVADPVETKKDDRYPLSMDFEKNGSKFDGFTIRAGTAPLADVKESNSFLLDAKKYNVKGSGDLLGGKGWWVYSWGKGEKMGTIAVEVQGPKYVISCEMGAEDAKALQETLDICKTITLLGG